MERKRFAIKTPEIRAAALAIYRGGGAGCKTQKLLLPIIKVAAKIAR